MRKSVPPPIVARMTHSFVGKAAERIIMGLKANVPQRQIGDPAGQSAKRLTAGRHPPSPLGVDTRRPLLDSSGNATAWLLRCQADSSADVCSRPRI
jgi:hypothetical protein